MSAREEGALDRASAWIYEGVWAVLAGLFKVPKEPPALPVAPGETLESFRPAPGFLRYLKFWFWIVLAAVDVVLFLAWLAILVTEPWLGVLLAIPALVVIVAPDILAYIAIHLRYDTTWYVISPRSVRIRRGIWVIHEVTVTFENIQNVNLVQGPVERYFGIADLVLETAGAGAPAGQHGGGGITNQAVIEGVADAARIRDIILPRLRRSRSAGLGDEAPPAASGGWIPERLEALREVRDEVRALARSQKGN